MGREITPGHRLVSESMLPEPIVACPHCGCPNFSLLGVLERDFVQEFENGKVKEPREDSITLAPKAVQQIEAIHCQGCCINTIIENDTNYERESLIFDLHLQIAVLQGRVGNTTTKEWRN